MQKYLFPEKLQQGLILSRPNRFIMLVRIKGKIEKCHCPSTGRIGGIIFKDVPCLFSKSRNPERKTRYTVEAISIDNCKSWIGINQNRANEFIEYFFRKGKLDGMAGKVKSIRREVTVGKSRIDFMVNGNLVEVKMPLITLPSSEKIKTKESKFNSFERLIRHFSELSKSLEPGKRAILVMCYVYNAEPFVPPKTDSTNSRIKNAARKAMAKGVENWQVNLKIDQDGVSLLKCLRLGFKI